MPLLNLVREKHNSKGDPDDSKNLEEAEAVYIRVPRFPVRDQPPIDDSFNGNQHTAHAGPDQHDSPEDARPMKEGLSKTKDGGGGRVDDSSDPERHNSLLRTNEGAERGHDPEDRADLNERVRS